MRIDIIYRYTFSIVLPLILLFFLYIFSPWLSINEHLDHKWNSTENQNGNSHKLINTEIKQKGGHIFGRIDSSNIQPFIVNNYEWITMVFWGNQKDFDSPTVTHFKGDSLKMVRRDSMWKTRIDLAHSCGMKVFLKPHIWIANPTKDKWRSDIFPSNKENWELWKESYREYILVHAQMAQNNNVELFCLGVELSRLSKKKSDFWRSLIREVRSIYKGKLTYAANWHDEYEDITFWDELDYIGIQAYFPLVKNKYPSVKQLSKGWSKYLPALESMHKKYNRKILFTEMGYKSTADSAIKPWEWVENIEQNDSASYETQANCYEAFFNRVWKQEWFAGVHIWQLRSDYVKGRGRSDFDFTPQGKPAEMIITNGFE